MSVLVECILVESILSLRRLAPVQLVSNFASPSYGLGYAIRVCLYTRPRQGIHLALYFESRRCGTAFRKKPERGVCVCIRTSKKANPNEMRIELLAVCREAEVRTLRTDEVHMDRWTDGNLSSPLLVGGRH